MFMFILTKNENTCFYQFYALFPFCKPGVQQQTACTNIVAQRPKSSAIYISGVKKERHLMQG